MASWAPGETAASRIERAIIEALDEVANRIYDDSQTQVPRSNDPERDIAEYGETLAESGKAPKNDPELGAAPGDLNAQVRYNARYAVAQHEGHAVMHREGAVVEWQAREYSTPGTKDHYLEDPMKAHIPTVEAVVGEYVQAALKL